jgi:hypothetical protein
MGVGEGFFVALEEIAAGNVNGKETVLEADFQEGKTSHSRNIKLSKISERGVLDVDKSTHENMGVCGEFSAELEKSVTKSSENLIKGKSPGSKQSMGNLSRGQERVVRNQTTSKLIWKKGHVGSLILPQTSIT